MDFNREALNNFLDGLDRSVLHELVVEYIALLRKCLDAIPPTLELTQYYIDALDEPYMVPELIAAYVAIKEKNNV